MLAASSFAAGSSAHFLIIDDAIFGGNQTFLSSTTCFSVSDLDQ